MTLPEILLWQALREEPCAPRHVRRQHPVGPHGLDVYGTTARLAVEVDGAAHDHPAQASHDEQRDTWLAGQGIRVLRVPARDILDRSRSLGVVAMIAAAAAEAGAP